MTSLVEALEALGVQGEILLSGRWVRIKGERCSVYIAEVVWNELYCTWCDDPQARNAEFYIDPSEAILAGMQRAGNQKIEL